MMKQYQTGVSLPSEQYHIFTFFVMRFKVLLSCHILYISLPFPGNHHDRLLTPDLPRSLCIACQLNDLFDLKSKQKNTSNLVASYHVTRTVREPTGCKYNANTTVSNMRGSNSKILQIPLKWHLPAPKFCE